MVNLTKIAKYVLFSLVLLVMSPFLLYFTVMAVWRIEYTVEDFIRNQKISRATSVIQPIYVDGQAYDIATIMIGISHSDVEYSREGDAFSIDHITYHMDSDVFDHYCSAWFHSYNHEDDDVEMIDDICSILNSYDLNYEFIEGYGYRGYFYGDGYVYGRYDASYLNGQYLELSLRPIEGKNIVLRFDLELPPDSLDYQIISDLKAMEHASDQSRVSSIHNILALVTPVEKEEEKKEPQILVIY